RRFVDLGQVDGEGNEGDCDGDAAPHGAREDAGQDGDGCGGLCLSARGGARGFARALLRFSHAARRTSEAAPKIPAVPPNRARTDTGLTVKYGTLRACRLGRD